MKNSLKQRLPGAWLAFWEARQPSERRALRLLALVMLGSLLLQLAWTLEQERRALLEHLPRLAAQAESMTERRTEWRQLSAPGKTAPTADAAMLRESMAQRVLQLGPGIAAQWSPDGTLKLSGTTQLADVLPWFLAVQQAERLFVSNASLQHDPAGIRLEAVLVPVR